MKPKGIVIHKERCKNCGICVVFCPKKVLAQDENERLYIADQSACNGCNICNQVCPDFAIEVIKEDE